MDNIPAIYEGGVFKPLQPVSLPERTEVSVALPSPAPIETPDDVAAKRREAVRRMFAEIDAIPQQPNNDGWSVANNADEILYGGPNGPA